jgi:alkane 1-monooxygenase
MHPLAYIAPLGLLLLGWLSVWLGGWWTVALPLVTFGLVPLLELALPPRPEAPHASQNSAGYDFLLLTSLPGQLGLIGLLLVQVSSGALQGWEILGAVLTVGTACGAFGINVAHELGHRQERWAQWASQALLLTSLYMHFFIEHNRGHHANVATPNDPASAAKGMTVYHFWWRSVTGSWRSAWQIEDRRRRKFTHPRLSWDHAITRFTLIQGAALGLALLCFGPLATASWVGAAVVGFLLLETVNYIEHYGLHRQLKANGRYERVRPEHSWNADYPVGRALLFELTRHSDHHAHPGRPYPTLRHFDDSPQLPTGYPGMIVLSLCPPLWFSVMNPHTEREQRRLRAAA